MISAFAGGKLFGERVNGSAPRVLALHGWRFDHFQMNPVVQPFDAITLDLPGFGKSPVPLELWGAAEYAKQVAEVLDEFESPTVVVGHSFGGRVAINMAALFPERIKGIVVAGSPLIRRGPSKKSPLGFRAMKWANKAGLVSDKRMEAERRKRGSADYRAASGLMRDIFVKLVNESYEDELRAIACPVELVWGEDDTEAPVRNAHEAMRLLQNGRLTVISKGTHWSVVDEPREVQAAIERCLS